MFDEKAYKPLADQGHKEPLDRLLYNRPELAFDEDQVALVAPPPNQSAYTDAFTEASVRSRIAEYGGLLPAAVLLGGCFGFALVLTVLYSFWRVVDFEVVPDWDARELPYFFTVDTYVRTFVATLAMVTVATALTLAVAVPFAYWLTRYVSRRWRRRLLIVVVLLLASYLLRVYAWLGIPGRTGRSTASCRPSGSRTNRYRSCSSTGRLSCWCSSTCTSRSRCWPSTSRWSSSTGARSRPRWIWGHWPGRGSPRCSRSARASSRRSSSCRSRCSASTSRRCWSGGTKGG